MLQDYILQIPRLLLSLMDVNSQHSNINLLPAGEASLLKRFKQPITVK